MSLLPDTSSVRRPGLAIVVVVLLALSGLSYAVLVALFAGIGSAAPAPWWATLVYGLVAAAYFVGGAAVFRGHSWGRVVGLSVAILMLVLGLIQVIVTRVPPSLLGILTQIAIVVLLMRRDVVQWCSRR